MNLKSLYRIVAALKIENNMTPCPWKDAFLKAMKSSKSGKNSGPLLRKLIAKQEQEKFGRVACYCCGYDMSKKERTIEHILPVSLGGTNELHNLALSHSICNAARGNNPTLRKDPRER